MMSKTIIFCQVYTISLLFFAWNFVIHSNPPFSDDGRWATAQSFIRKKITSYRWVFSQADDFENRNTTSLTVLAVVQCNF
jgi:hypothetical protein